MDPIKAQKVRAMKLYKKSDPFFQSLILHSLLALACSLFCSYSHSFPNSFYAIKHLLFNSLPNTWSWFVNPSCLFVVVNCIVVFLIGESRIMSRKQSLSPVDHVYDEYVARTRSLRGRPSTTVQEIKKQEKIVLMTMDDPKEDNANGIEDHTEVNEVLPLKEDSGDGHDEDFEECEGNVTENEIHDEEEEEKEILEEENEQEDDKEQEKEEEEEEAIGIPADELNKRVEDFIARVNKQRWLEARFLVGSY
ncbi:PREDICTED: myelin transcription factor 1-like [Fragaria vesca subsp. vesca]|uniref:myelin transcription factor 1-like n=1 Tax=Fragaria vesca subsp. vesca TaxID=101020 RepID=UPI0002C34DF3|nr:PREDICTED: myelin transcription factor 1-like [Fragaria vesca subsp. vesca]